MPSPTPQEAKIALLEHVLMSAPLELSPKIKDKYNNMLTHFTELVKTDAGKTELKQMLKDANQAVLLEKQLLLAREKQEQPQGKSPSCIFSFCPFAFLFFVYSICCVFCMFLSPLGCTVA